MPERKGSRDRRRNRRLVEDERDAVVDEALALDDRDHPTRRADAAGDFRGSKRVGWRDDGAEGERPAPRQAVDGLVRNPGDAHSRDHDQSDGEHRDRAQVGAQVAQAREEGRRVEERRQDRDEDEIRRQRQLRHTGQEAEHETAADEQDRGRQPPRRGGDEHGTERREQREELQLVVGGEREQGV